MHREREVQHQLSESGAENNCHPDTLYPIVENSWSRTPLRSAIVTNPEHFVPEIGLSARILSFQQLLDGNGAPPRTKIDIDNDLAALQFTGGTTGTSKGAMLTHRNLVSNAIAFGAWINGTAEDTFLTALPLFHIYGMIRA